jgi:hypothetical protein
MVLMGGLAPPRASNLLDRIISALSQLSLPACLAANPRLILGNAAVADPIARIDIKIAKIGLFFIMLNQQ